jgi:hypothetical protein
MIDFNEFGKTPNRLPESIDPPCPTELLAEHHVRFRGNRIVEPRKTFVHIVDAENAPVIGRGKFGVIYAVRAIATAWAPGDPEHPLAGTGWAERKRGREFSAVLKVYRTPELARHALESYDLCKNAGLRVPQTYRADIGKMTVIMSDLRVDDSYVISGNIANWSIGAEALHKKPLEGVANWDEVLQIMLSEPLVRDRDGEVVSGSEAARATAHEIELQPDVYFFKLPFNERIPRFVPLAADYDIVRHPVPEKTLQELGKYNLQALGTTAKLVAETFIEEEKQPPLLKALAREYHAALSQFE